MSRFFIEEVIFIGNPPSLEESNSTPWKITKCYSLLHPFMNKFLQSAHWLFPHCVAKNSWEWAQHQLREWGSSPGSQAPASPTATGEVLSHVSPRGASMWGGEVKVGGGGGGPPSPGSSHQPKNSSAAWHTAAWQHLHNHILKANYGTSSREIPPSESTWKGQVLNSSTRPASHGALFWINAHRQWSGWKRQWQWV